MRRIIGEDIQVVQALATDLWSVEVDSGQIVQVLMNLAVNARDAMPDGGTLTIATDNVEFDEAYVGAHPEATAGRCVALSITDTGSGMSDEVKAHLFEPLFTTKEEGQGTGLGLATVYGIVTQSEGTIHCQSEQGVGTSFTVYLPRITEKGEDPVREGQEADLVLGCGTILVVEDEQVVRKLAMTVLRKAGYTVLSSASAQEALAQVEDHPETVDLLLTDVVLPDVAGPYLARRIVRNRPGIKVLYMSGYTDNPILRQLVLEKGSYFIRKPFTPVSLTGKVREILDSTGITRQSGPGVAPADMTAHTAQGA